MLKSVLTFMRDSTCELRSSTELLQGIIWSRDKINGQMLLHFVSHD